ncbi:MAG: hypothetical protein AB7Q42_13435 [Acidimicrobiia bacterium]
MFAFDLVDVMWIVLSAAAVGGLFWLAVRIEPHWSAKDGKAFTCRIQAMRPSGAIEGRWREARAIVSGNEVKLIVRGLGQPVTPYEAHRVLRQADAAQKGRALFVLSGDPMYLLRIPESSKAVTVLQEMITPL